jgi:hypothetical protein
MRELDARSPVGEHAGPVLASGSDGPAAYRWFRVGGLGDTLRRRGW